MIQTTRIVTVNGREYACVILPSGLVEHARPAVQWLLTLLDAYPSGTGVIRYRDGSGKEKDWFIGVTADDNEATLREHLKKHLPAADFVGWAVK